MTQVWDLMRELRDMSNLPWCIIGDFNDLLTREDKQRIHPHLSRLCVGFKNAVGDCDLISIKLEGHHFIWIRSRRTSQVIEERLERAMENIGWLDIFHNVQLLSLLTSHSDHSPIIVTM